MLLSRSAHHQSRVALRTTHQEHVHSYWAWCSCPQATPPTSDLSPVPTTCYVPKLYFDPLTNISSTGRTTTVHHMQVPIDCSLHHKGHQVRYEHSTQHASDRDLQRLRLMPAAAPSLWTGQHRSLARVWDWQPSADTTLRALATHTCSQPALGIKTAAGAEQSAASACSSTHDANPHHRHLAVKTVPPSNHHVNPWRLLQPTCAQALACTSKHCDEQQPMSCRAVAHPPRQAGKHFGTHWPARQLVHMAHPQAQHK